MELHSGFKLLGNISGATYNIQTTGNVMSGTFEDGNSGLLSNAGEANLIYTRNISPRADNASNIGTVTARYKTIYATELSGATIKGSSTITDLSGQLMSLSGNNLNQHNTFLLLSGSNANQLIDIGANAFKTTGLISGGGIYSSGDALFKNPVTVVNDPNVILEGGTGGYGTGISFASRTSAGGTLVEMGRIVCDGAAAWNTTPATQDADMSFWVTIDGTQTKTLTLENDGDLILSRSKNTALLVSSTNTNNGNGAAARFLCNNGTANTYFQVTGTGVSESLYIRPNSSLFLNDGTGAGIDIASIGTGGDIRFWTGTTEKMRISGAGNIVEVIGTISGNAIFTSGAISGNNLYISGGRNFIETNISGALTIKKLYKLDGTTPAADGDILKWEAGTGRIYGG